MGVDQQWRVREHWVAVMQAVHLRWGKSSARDEINSCSWDLYLLSCAGLFRPQTMAHLISLNKSIKGQWWGRKHKQEGQDGRAGFRAS